MTDLDHLIAHLSQQDGVWVRVVGTQGSVPREVGAWMAVFGDATAGKTIDTIIGTIGGGHLEWQAIAHARDAATVATQQQRRFALGPSLGQCCGGVVDLVFEPITAADVPRLRDALSTHAQPVALFGGGHVGSAIVHALAPLPFAVRWVDSRDGIFPDDLPANVVAEHSDPVQAAVADLAPGSRVLIMSFSHAEDLDVVIACLKRQRERCDLPFIGLIGSATKWATFRRRLAERGFAEAEIDRITCPIGLPGIEGKAPAVIAASVAAQLLMLG